MITFNRKKLEKLRYELAPWMVAIVLYTVVCLAFVHFTYLMMLID